MLLLGKKVEKGKILFCVQILENLPQFSWIRITKTHCSPNYGLFTFICSTVWKKRKSGLQFWGSAGKLRETHRAHCPHTQFVSGNYSLWINDVRTEDGGVYSCMVEGEGSTVVMLRIIEGMKTFKTSWLPIIPKNNNSSKFQQRSRCVFKCLPHVFDSDHLSSCRCVGDGLFCQLPGDPLARRGQCSVETKWQRTAVAAQPLTNRHWTHRVCGGESGVGKAGRQVDLWAHLPGWGVESFNNSHCWRWVGFVDSGWKLSLLLVLFYFFPTKDVLSDLLLGFFRDNPAPGWWDQGVRLSGLPCHHPLCFLCCFETQWHRLGEDGVWVSFQSSSPPPPCLLFTVLHWQVGHFDRSLAWGRRDVPLLRDGEKPEGDSKYEARCCQKWEDFCFHR